MLLPQPLHRIINPSEYSPLCCKPITTNTETKLSNSGKEHGELALGETRFADFAGIDRGSILRGALEQMIPNHDHLFESVRGLGLMLGVKMKTDSRAFVNYLREHGLLTVAAGDNVMRVLPPLVIEDAHVTEFVERLSEAARAYEVPQAA